jgi:copper(I)-binding protein
MSMSNGVMKMQELANGLEIKPGETVELKPGGLHLMFVNLKKPLTEGEHVKATLNFAKAGKVDVDFTVAGIGARSAGGAPSGSAGHAMPGMKMK